MGKIFILVFLFAHCAYGQVKTVLDSLDDPIALTFDGDNVYLALHGRYPNTGKLVSFNINNPKETYRELFDSLIYPRAIIVKKNVIYLGLRDGIFTCNLDNNGNLKLDTLFYKQFLFPRSFAFNGDELYYAHEKALSRINLSSQNIVSKSLFHFGNSPLSIANHNKSIYIAAGKTIHKYDLEENRISTLIEDLKYNVYTILIVDDFLYLDQSNLSNEGEEIIAYNLKNLDLGPVSFCTNLGNLISQVEYKDNIYIANLVPSNIPEGKILMINKNLLKQVVEHTIKIYPNPTSNAVTIETLFINETNFNLYNAEGKFVTSFSNSGNLELGSLPAGMYLLQYENSKIKGSKNIIKVNK